MPNRLSPARSARHRPPFRPAALVVTRVDPLSVSPYLLRPLRSYEEVLRARERDRVLYGLTGEEADGIDGQTPAQTLLLGKRGTNAPE